MIPFSLFMLVPLPYLPFHLRRFSIAAGLAAVLVSTLAIMVFGEIIPQSIACRYGMAMGANTIYITYVFVAVLFPLSYPIAKVWVASMCVRSMFPAAKSSAMGLAEDLPSTTRPLAAYFCLPQMN